MNKKTILTLAALLLPIPLAHAQTRIKTAALRGDQIALINTAQGITTRISFPDAVQEIICGDLYDPRSGQGSFIVQRGDNDVFLKPVTISGASNLFVRIGKDGEHIYAFDLSIVPANQACRVFNVVPAPVPPAPAYQFPEAAKIIADAEGQAREIVRAADQRIAQMRAEAEQRAPLIERDVLDRSRSTIDHRFARAVMTGLSEIRAGGAQAAGKGITVTLDQCAIALDGQLYLRYVIQNLSNNAFTFSRLSLESGLGDKRKVIQARITQSKSENTLAPREALVGIIVVDRTAALVKDGFSLLVRGAENSEIAQVTVSP